MSPAPVMLCHSVTHGGNYPEGPEGGHIEELFFRLYKASLCQCNTEEIATANCWK